MNSKSIIINSHDHCCTFFNSVSHVICDILKNWATAVWKPLEFPRHRAVSTTQYLHIHYANSSYCSLINLHCVSNLQSIYELTPIIVLFGDPLHWYCNFLFWQTWSFVWSQFYIIIPSNTILSKKNIRKANLVPINLLTLTHFRFPAQQRSLLQSAVHGDPIEHRLLLSLWTSFNFFNPISVRGDVRGLVFSKILTHNCWK